MLYIIIAFWPSYGQNDSYLDNSDLKAFHSLIIFALL